MKKFVSLIALLVLALSVSCAKPPAQAIKDARDKIEMAKQTRSLNPELEKKAQDMEEELALQNTKFFKSYLRTRQLCDEICAYDLNLNGRQPQMAGSPVPVEKEFKYCPYCGHSLP